MGKLLAKAPARDLKKMRAQLDELESRTTAEELNRMQRQLRKVVSAARLRKVVKRA